MRGGRRAAAALPCLLLAVSLVACTGEAPPPPPPWRELPGASPDIQRAGVIHADRLGRLQQQLDPARSFFPLVLDNAMVDYSRGLRFGFQAAAAAGFNAVAPWSDQPRDAVLEAAAGSRLLAVLADEDAPDTRARAESLETSVVFDPRFVHLVRLEPFIEGRPADLAGTTGLQRLEQAVAAQTRLPQPPAVWAVLQSYAAPADRKRLPSSAEARALAYAAIVQGATGLVWFGEDSYAARAAGALGVAPLPPMEYGISLPDSGRMLLRPDAAQIGQARSLWQSLSRLNREIERLSPALLSPRAAESLTLSVQPAGPGTAAPALPVRGMLRLHDGQYLLVLVNITDQPWHLRSRIGRPMRRIERWFDDRPPPALTRGGTELEAEFGPFEVQVFRLSP